jgi:hypothetical protein
MELINIFLPTVSTSIYIGTSYYLNKNQNYFKELYTTSKNYKNIIKYISIFHNLGLCLFSLYTFINLYFLIQVEYNSFHPKNWTINHYIVNDKISNLNWLFLYSKIWEFLDTWLILLKGQNTIFLQKFHHFGAVWIWYLSCYYNTSNIIIGTFFNSFVHTIMYFYYLLTTFGLRFNKIKPFITSLQLLQLFIGNCINIWYVIIPNTNIIVLISIVCNLYTFTLIFLFIQFSLKTYKIKYC